MLLNTMSKPCPQVSPEAAQSLFETIFEDLKSRLRITWKLTAQNQISAVPVWKSKPTSQVQSKHSSRRLASLTFPRSEAQVSHYFSELTDEVTEQEILESFSKHPQHFPNQELPISLIRYRLITASIALAAGAVIAGPEFVQIRHCTKMSLLVRLKGHVTELTDALFTSGLSYSGVASLVAHIHCGLESLTLTEDDNHPSYSSGQYEHMPKALG